MLYVVGSAPDGSEGTNEPMENTNTIGVMDKQIPELTNVASGPCVSVSTDTLKDDIALVVLDCEDVLCGRHFVYLQIGLWPLVKTNCSE